MFQHSGLKIERVFSKNGASVYENIKFKTAKSELKNADGSVVSVSSELIVPEHWSSFAIDILARNYLRKRGVPLHLKAVEEHDVPSWLWRKTADTSLDLPREKLFGAETDVRQVFDRLAGTWTYWGWKNNYFASEEDARAFFDEMRYILTMQMGAPNSPQWFNTGIYWAYGIEGSAQGHYYFDEAHKVLKRSTSAYERPQPHACFIQHVSDDLVNEGGIMDLWIRESRLFKFGSGTGSNFSNIRGAGEPLSGGGFSSGLMSFLKIGDTIGGSIKSGGTTRRAAKMVIVDIDHPDIEDFIKWKSREELKVLDLVVGSKILKKHTEKLKQIFANFSDSETSASNGIKTTSNDSATSAPSKNINILELKKTIEEAKKEYVPEAYIARILNLLKNGKSMDVPEFSINWDSEAYSTVSGQNSNNSVRVTDEFLQAVENDKDFHLHWRIDKSICKTLKARYLWNEIAEAAWNCADPGIQFDTTINSWNTCPNDGRINASNPCSEYMFLDDTACNLASLNLCAFVNEDNDGKIIFDIAAFKHVIRLFTIVLEISITMAQFPSRDIALRSYQFRSLGLGFGNLGALLMQSGIPYDSEIGRNIAAAIAALLQGIAYKTSAEMASVLGTFERFENNKNEMMRVIKNHAIAAIGDTNFDHLNITPQILNHKACLIPDLADQVARVWADVLELGEKVGFRNAQVSVIAPTGTIGFVMDFKTTGVEPQFSQVAIKNLTGGGILKLVNDDIKKALKILGYSSKEISAIEHYVIGSGNLDSNIKINNSWLLNKGFSVADIEKLNRSLAKAFDIRQSFTSWVLGNEFFERLGINIAKTQDPNFDLLSHLGATVAEINEANEYCCGRMTIEGAPGLKEEHLPIFDCAIPCGKGKRSLSYESHIKMMAAIQPFISGAISKTINLPKSATIQECADAYMLAWKLGLKSVALYRDGSKYSQALNAGIAEELELFEDFDSSIEETIDTADENSDSIKKYAKESQDKSINQNTSCCTNDSALNSQKTIGFGSIGSKEDEDKLKMTSRKEEIPFIPFRRRGYTQHVRIGEDPLWHTTGEDEDGQLKSILLTFGREGSTLRAWASAWGRILSMYLQEKGGCALLRAYKAFKHSRFEPMGEILGHPTIKQASSIPDYIVEDLAHSYEKMMSTELNSISLPSQRPGKINKIRIGQETMYIIIGEDSVGKPIEIFVAGMGNEGADLRGWMNSCAKLISLYFQDCGDSAVWQFINAFEGSNFEPSGFIQGHSCIKSATSPLDFLAKHLRYQYGKVLSGEQLVLEVEESITKNIVVNSTNSTNSFDLKIRTISGYKSDEPCKSCRSFKLRYNGTCYICDNCFTTTGCS